MRVSELLISGERKLRQSASPRLDAELLLAHALGIERAMLYTLVTDIVHPKMQRLFLKLVDLRSKRYPVAYITGSVDTPIGPLSVDPRVLVPRPTTELLVQTAIQALKNHPGSVADMGTGSGIIAISLARALPAHTIEASDISMAALEVARKNAARYQLEDRITWRWGSLFQPWRNILEPDAIVANLPYVPAAAAASPDLQYEPRLALVGGPDGLQHLHYFTHQLNYHPLVRLVALECQPDQVDTLSYWLRKIKPVPFSVKPIQDGAVAWGVLAQRY